jgi:hypothetical protein
VKYIHFHTCLIYSPRSAPLPWSMPYLLPAAKWEPIYWPPQEWEIFSFPLFDDQGTKLWPKPPDGATIKWWQMPKESWPIEAPWEAKVFGAWPGNKVLMSEDLPPSIWPGGHRTPPFGWIKLKMPGTPDVSSYQGPKDNPIPFTHMKMHMRPEIGPITRMKIMTRINAFGETKFYMIDKNWDQYEYDHKIYRAAMKQRKLDRFMTTLVQEIVRTKGQPQPSKDLFA